MLAPRKKLDRQSLVVRCTVIGLTSLLLLASCKSTATVEMIESADSPEQVTSSAANDEPPAVDSAEDASSQTPEDGANFVVQGELPLSTDEVNGLIAFIEDETGRAFLRPPVIVAQSGDEFIADLQSGMDDFDADAEISVRTLQALGLTDKGVAEVSQAFRALLLSPEGILGYYDAEADELYVPVDAGGDDAFRSLLVHELTHALDGQHADLNVLEALVEQGDETGDYEPVLAIQAVAEGRATSVQNSWMRQNNVPPEQIPQDLGAAANVPPAMLLSLSVPYAFGEQYINAKGGPAETWGLLDEPPASSEEFMVAFSDVSGQAIVDVPTPTAEGPVLDEAVYGAADILVWLLGEALEPDPVLLLPTFGAIDGWAGGRSVLWGDDAESCMRIAIAADSDKDLTEIQSAIELWADDSVDRTVIVQDDLVVATGCAPYVP